MRARWRGPALAGAIGGGLSLVLLRRGVVMGPDSWAYWEGSVSLLERGRYAYFGGVPITAFPPLFSAALALVQAGLGVSARTLAAFLSLLVALASVAWTAVYQAVRPERSRSLSDALAVLVLPATLAVSGQTLLSESLWLALLPLLLLLLIAPSIREGPALVAAWLALCALLLTRNATVALLPGAGLLLWRRQAGAPAPRRLLVVAAVLAGALWPWYLVRARLGQLETHPLGHGALPTLAYARQALAGLANGLGPSRGAIGPALLVALAALFAWEASRPPAGDRSRAMALVWFAALGLAGHVAIFRATYVAEPLAGRFVTFAVLALAAATLALGTSRRAFLALSVALTAVALYRAGAKAHLAGVEQPTVALDVRISSSYPSGPPRAEGGRVLVAPPTYPWIPRR